MRPPYTSRDVPNVKAVKVLPHQHQNTCLRFCIEASCEERNTHLETGGAAQYESMSMTSIEECSFPNVLREYNIHLEGILNVASSGTHPLHELD